MEIFVFGSNLAGRHDKGAALFARKNHEAIYGQGAGIQGQSYALPTKDADIQTLPLVKINHYLQAFILFASAHPEHHFNITRIGCGLAGYDWETQIKPMFSSKPDNCTFI